MVKWTRQAQKRRVPQEVPYLYIPSLKPSLNPLSCIPQCYSECIHTPVHLLLTSPALTWWFRGRQILVGSLACSMELALGLEVCTGFESILRGEFKTQKSPEQGVENEGNRLREKERCEASKPSQTTGRTQRFFKRPRVRLHAQKDPETQPMSCFSSILKLCPRVSASLWGRPFSQGSPGNTRLLSS